jgi:hexosaminidase
VGEIKQMLDAMALHKLNTFHWHLTDDQGWRIEIKQYPELTKIGDCRIPAGDGGLDAAGRSKPYCGYYTQEQIRDVVRYAAALHITIVPEVDVPGHATAAIAAYPQLGVLDTPPVVSNEWGVNTNLFNVEESTFVFLENVLGEVVDLFPGAYVHVGGDEAVKDQWKASARVQERIRELGVKDEAGMQSYLIKRLEKYLVAKHRRLIGWDEILEGGLPEEATVMSWRGIEGGITAANQGHDVVMAPSSELYLDYLQTDSPNEPPGRPATIPLKQVYAFEPVPAAANGVSVSAFGPAESTNTSLCQPPVRRPSVLPASASFAVERNSVLTWYFEPQGSAPIGPVTYGPRQPTPLAVFIDGVKFAATVV